MLNTLVPVLNTAVGRLIVGVLNLSSDHPVVLCLILAVLAGAATAVLLDIVGGGRPARMDEKPIPLRRR